MKLYVPVRKLTAISKRNIESETKLKMRRPVWLMFSYKNEMAIGNIITLAISKISMTRSQ